MDLSITQEEAYQAYLDGENVLLSGAGGSGKSTLVRKINDHALECDKKIQICALTGCASLLLNCKATTIHSWAGIGIQLKGKVSEIARLSLSKYGVKGKFRSVDILVIDEISMLSKKLFEILDLMGKRARSNTMPFGGIQLIFSGDFFQLPPIGDDDESRAFCFESSLWNSTFSKQVELTTIFRQKSERYVKILSQVRRGKISRKSFDILSECIGKEQKGDIKPTRLYPRRKMVDKVNKSHLDALDGDLHTFTAKVSNLKQNVDEKAVETFKSQIMCGLSIDLKVGAQVMCVVNMDLNSDQPICNGSCGIITGFSGEYPVVKFTNGLETTISPHSWLSHDESIEISQIPLILAWSISIHKSQGATLDMAEIDIGSGIFEYGQTYVALSRVKSLDGLYITSIDPWQIKADPKVLKFYESLKEL